ncbi:MAG: penicillin-binding transpeptidase domain-containing protein, partial [Pseudomonadota bacterium]|nr:penicillin-binding transpeptidase domain-containing protein [Pseudomonadota bacterium]
MSYSKRIHSRRHTRKARDKRSGKKAMALVWRQHFLLALLFAGFAVLAFRVVQLQTSDHERLQTQGDARYLRDVKVQPARGRILDRNGRMLAVSTPVDSVWAEPPQFCAAGEQWGPLLKQLRLKRSSIEQACAKRGDSGFMYLRRRLTPDAAQEVLALGVPGVALQREYKRYYPGGPAAAHLIGFTDIDDLGQEGLEKQFDEQLHGHSGREKVLKDLAGHYVEHVESIRQVEDGADLVISIDERLQFLASGYLEQAVREHKAAGGSVVLLSVRSGEILAMVNSPQFNPNDRSTMRPGVFRNRAVTDVIEPGSTAKPFTVAMALESGRYNVNTLLDTSPGRYRIGRQTISDVHDYGEITVAE